VSALDDLAARLRADGGALAGAVAEPTEGPAFAGLAGDRGYVAETIHEGYRVHYGEGRVVRTEDPDLALLAGDRLYALGLARLAELGDLHAVGVLADVIAATAQAHAEGDPGRAAAAWEEGAAALGEPPDG
jgi:hypothetical protein